MEKHLKHWFKVEKLVQTEKGGINKINLKTA